MAYKNLTDMHTHTDNSFDGNCSVMLLCEQAVHKCIKTIAFTDHFDVDFYEEHNLAMRQVHGFFEISKAKEAFKGKLNVLLGIELGQPTYDLELTEKSLKKFNYDFVIGSIHNLRKMPDFGDLKYPEMTDDEIYGLLEQYFKEELLLAQWNKFDTLAHLTYPLRYLAACGRNDITTERFGDIIDEIFKTLAQNGKALEINTSGLRQPIGKTMPSEEYVRRFKELGGELITVGSDAHFAEHIGAGIKEGFEIAKAAGFDYVTIFEKRKPISVKIEKL